MRPKLSIPAQIKDMKEAGIAFEIMSESEAKQLLDTATYYFRIKAYSKNYSQYTETEKQGQYINLDFAYLVDLCKIDTYLRKVILQMSIELEHFLKVKMLSDFNTTYEDGYEIINEFFTMQPHLKDEIELKINTSTCNELITKYKDGWAIWNIVEVMSFGQFIDLYALFYARNNFSDSYVNILLPVRMIRNAVAHNNCLLNRLKPPYSRNISPCFELRNELMQHAGIPKKAIEKRLIQPAIHDFAALSYLHSKVVPTSEKEQTNLRIKDVFYNIILENSSFYDKNEILKSSYSFVESIVAFYCKES